MVELELPIRLIVSIPLIFVCDTGDPFIFSTKVFTKRIPAIIFATGIDAAHRNTCMYIFLLFKFIL